MKEKDKTENWPVCFQSGSIRTEEKPLEVRTEFVLIGETYCTSQGHRYMSTEHSRYDGRLGKTGVYGEKLALVPLRQS
jgi:hypothetical protein